MPMVAIADRRVITAHGGRAVGPLFC